MIEPNNTYSYLFIRKDLSMAQKIIQATHAGMQMAFQHNDKAKCFAENTPNIVLVLCDNEQALNEVQCQLEIDKVQHMAFYEPDLDMALTAISSAPLQAQEKNKFLRKQKLATEKELLIEY